MFFFLQISIKKIVFVLLLLYFASCNSHTKTPMRKKCHQSTRDVFFRKSVTKVDHVASDAEKRSNSFSTSEIHIVVSREMSIDNYT